MTVSTSNILEVHSTVTIIVPNFTNLSFHSKLQVSTDCLRKCSASIERCTRKRNEWSKPALKVAAAKRRSNGRRDDRTVALSLQDIEVTTEELRILDWIQWTKILSGNGGHKRQKSGEESELHDCDCLLLSTLQERGGNLIQKQDARKIKMLKESGRQVVCWCMVFFIVDVVSFL